MFLISLGFYVASCAVLVASLNPLLLSHGKTNTQVLYHVRKSKMAHFYVLGTVWTLILPWILPNLMGLLGLHCSGSPSLAGSALYICILSQVSKRAFEVTSVTKSTGTMHILHYLAGIGFYLAMPVALLGPSLCQESQKPSWLLVAGLSLFIVSCFFQWVCHVHLARLRLVKSDYVLPNIMFFKLVACPHYTFEILMYLGLALIAVPAFPTRSLWMHPAVSVVVWTLCILSISANEQLKWYQTQFPAKSPRYRLVPLLF